MKTLTITFLLSVLLLFQSCSKSDKDNCNGICTEEFRSIVVTIQDSEGNPVALDSFKVTDIENGIDLSPEINDVELQVMRERGTYPIFSDKYSREYFEQELEINFTGFINNREMVSTNYKVGADCCHVYHISGDLNIEIDVEDP